MTNNKKQITNNILLTAFEPYNDHHNASQLAVESIMNDPPEELQGIALHCRIMPVDTHRIREVVIETIEELRPEICLFTGQAPGSNRLALERVAINLRDFGSTPDTAGNTMAGQLIEPDGPVGYWSTLPDQEGLIASLNEAGIPSRISNHAGNHLCNQILYTALHWAAHNRPAMRIGFLHIPLAPMQIGGTFAAYPFMPLEMSRRAIAMIVERLVQDSRASLTHRQ